MPTTTPTPANRRAFEEVCDNVRALLASGALQPGDKLPPERELAQDLKVSRSAVREALRSLENAGLIRLRRGPLGGAFIRDGDGGSITQTLQDMVTLGTVSAADLTEARIYLLEPVVRLACERATAEDLQRLADNVERLATVLGPEQHEARLQCAIDFYRILGAAAKNPILRIVVDSVSELVQRVLQPAMYYPTDTLLQSRRRFLARLQARDADGAAAEMNAHLKSLHQHTLAKRGPNLKV